MAQGLGLSICSLVTLVAGAILVLVAFYNIFKGRMAKESEVEVVQRQLRGFATLTVANIIMVLGTLMCAGGLMSVLNLGKN